MLVPAGNFVAHPNGALSSYRPAALVKWIRDQSRRGLKRPGWGLEPDEGSEASE